MEKKEFKPIESAETQPQQMNFSPTEWKYFVMEINDIFSGERNPDLGRCVRNARYLAEIERRTKNVEEGKNIVFFTAEEWEKFVNEQAV